MPPFLPWLKNVCCSWSECRYGSAGCRGGSYRCRWKSRNFFEYVFRVKKFGIYELRGQESGTDNEDFRRDISVKYQAVSKPRALIVHEVKGLPRRRGLSSFNLAKELTKNPQ